MAETALLETLPRTAMRKATKNLRQQGIIPVNVYGKGMESLALQIDEKALRHALQHATSSSLFQIKLGDKTENVLAHHVQRHPVTRRIIHVDLYKINMETKLHLRLPIVFVGEAPAVKMFDGVVLHLLDGLNLEALPGDLPHDIPVDISVLTEIEQSIQIKDIDLGPNVRVLDDPEEMVVKIQPPRVVTEEVVTAAAPTEGEAAPAAEAPAPEAPAGEEAS